MQISIKHSLIATAYLALNAYALPYPLSYSVVNVDGGGQSSATPTTVYSTVIESANSETTVSVTVVETPSTTAVMTDYTTQWTHAEATETALVPEVSMQPSATESGHPTYYVPVPNVTPQSTPEGSTVTVVSVTTATPSTSTEYYDNGMWHTSYAIKDNAYSVHPGQWQPSSSPAGYAASGTVAHLAPRAWATGTGFAYLAPRAWATGTGARLAPRAWATGYRNAMGWNSTSFYV